MAHKTDLRRMAHRWVGELERAMAPVNLSVRFEEWSGTWQGDARKAGSAWTVGGMLDPISGARVGDADEPAIIYPVQSQQVPPLRSEAQFLCVFGAQRSGKTYIGRAVALETLLRPGAIVFYLIPKFGKESIVLDGLTDRIEGAGWLVRHDGNLHTYETICGSRLHVFSAADRKSEETFLGGECDLAVIEEFREMPDRVFAKMFSRIISRNGRLAIVTSPEGGHMIEEIDRGEWADRVAFDVHHLDVRRNFWIYDRAPDADGEHDIIKIAAKLYDERRFRRDVQGENVSESGADFYNYDSAIHVVDSFPGVPCTEHLWKSEALWLSRDPAWNGTGSVHPDPELRHIRLIGLDFGAAIMTAIECGLYTDEMVDAATAVFTGRKQTELTPYNTTIAAIRELTKEDTSVMDFVPNVLQAAGLTPDVAVIFCDPSGNARDHVVGQSPVDMLRHRFGYRVFAKPGGSLRLPGIWAMRELFQRRRLLVSRMGCPQLAKDLAKVRTIGRNAKDVSRDPLGHRPDALRYVVDNILPVRDLFADTAAFRAALDAYGVSRG